MPTRTPAPEVSFAGTEFEGKTPTQVKNALYTKALQDLRNEHLEEFTDLIEGLYKTYGLTYRRRLTDQQKDEQQARLILARNPGLLAVLAADVEGAEVGEVEVTTTQVGTV